MQNKKISILGCGWLGLPLGKHLVEKGFSIKGSTTKEEKLPIIRENEIEPFLLKLNPEIECKSISQFLDSEILIINIPPKINFQKIDAHVEQISNLITEIKKSNIENIIYISSTSVYPELNREVFEEDVILPENSACPTLVKAENLLKENFEKLTILRCGGLMGYDRIPAKYFSGWKGLTTGETPVNYIHRDDLIRIIEACIRQNHSNQTFNIVSPIHPKRKEIYEKNCRELGFEMPEFVEPKEPEPFKIISSKKWIETTGYEFHYENPLDFYYERKSE